MYHVSNTDKLQRQLTASKEVGMGVDEKTVKAIWEDRYIEFSLLSFPEDRGKYDISYDSQLGTGAVHLRPKNKKVITSTHMWNRKAFDMRLRKPGNEGQVSQIMTCAEYL